MSETKGKVKQIAGFVTGDRKVEAAGRVEQQAADADSPVEEVDETRIADEEQEVRQEHGDVPSGAAPATPVPESPVSEQNLQNARAEQRRGGGSHTPRRRGQ